MFNSIQCNCWWQKDTSSPRKDSGECRAIWLTDWRGVEEGKVGVGEVVRHVNGLPFLPWLPQISPIASEIQASLTPGRPAGIAGPAQAFISLGPDGTVLESWHFHWWGEGKKAGEVKDWGLGGGHGGVWVNGGWAVKEKLTQIWGNTVCRRRTSLVFALKSRNTEHDIKFEILTSVKHYS